MTTVRCLMRTDIATLEPEETLRKAVEVLVSAGTGGAPVVSGGRLLGVVSLSDVLAFEADEPGVPSYRPDAESDSDEMDEEDAEDQAGRWFAEMWNGAGGDLSNRLATTDGPEWDELDEHCVAEVMTRRVVSVPSHASVQEAALVMDRAGVHRLMVVDEGTVVGVLGARDVVRAVAEGLLVPQASAEPLHR